MLFSSSDLCFGSWVARSAHASGPVLETLEMSGEVHGKPGSTFLFPKPAVGPRGLGGIQDALQTVSGDI